MQQVMSFCVCVWGGGAHLSTNLVKTDKFFTASCINDIDLQKPAMFEKYFLHRRT
jgi:hypothetical protein